MTHRSHEAKSVSPPEELVRTGTERTFTMAEKIDWTKECREIQTKASMGDIPPIVCTLVLFHMLFVVFFGQPPGKLISVIGVLIVFACYVLKFVETQRLVEGLRIFRDHLDTKDSRIESYEAGKLKLQAKLGDEIEFRKEFNPTPEQVDARLSEFARAILRSCQEETKLLAKGVSLMPPPALADSGADPEFVLQQCTKTFESLLALAKAHVQSSKANFWSFWKLASDREFIVQKSWRPYAEIAWSDAHGNQDKDFPFQEQGEIRRVGRGAS